MTGEKTNYHPVSLKLPEVKLELPKGTDDDNTDWYRPNISWVAPVMKEVEDIRKKSGELQELLKIEAKK
jgi:hypothetical protein